MQRLLQVVLDTNVLVAGLRSMNGASAAILTLLRRGDFDLHISLPVLLEYKDVLGREAHTRVDRSAARLLLEYLKIIAVFHEIHFLLRPALPDPRDDTILELAVTARADYLVTHNLRHFVGAEA